MSSRSPDLPPVIPYAPVAQAAEPPKGAMLTIFFIALVDMLGFGLIIPLLPIYARHFQASPFQVGLLFAIFSICQFIATPILGTWSDRIGRRPILFLSLLGNTAGYALLAFATLHHWQSLTLGLLTLYLARIVAGLTAGNISAAQAYISDITAPENRTRGMGVLGAAFGIGFSVGPAAGGLLDHYVGHAAPAFLAASLGLFAAAFCYLFLKEARDPTSSATSINYLQLSRFAPLFANRELMKINACWFISMAAYVAADSAIVMFLADVFHYDTRQIAWYFLVVGVVIIITQGGLVGRLSRKHGEWSLCILGLMLNGVGSLLTAATAWYPHALLLYASAVIYAFGRSLFQPTISALVSRHSEADKQGLSFGFFQAVGTLARVAGPLGAGIIYAYHQTWPWIGGSIVLWITALWLTRVHRSEAHLQAS